MKYIGADIAIRSLPQSDLCGGAGETSACLESLKVPYYPLFHQYIIVLRYIQNMSLKCLARNTKQIIVASHNPLCFSPGSKVLILCLLL